MSAIGTPGGAGATRALLLGSGELGKEVTIELQRLGVEVIAADRYASAPAMQVAHRHHVLSMLDGAALRRVVEAEHPDFIIPEIEAIATDVLVDLEAQGHCVVPTARAAHLTMNRAGIRRLAAEELGLPTSPYAFARDRSGFGQAVIQIGYPCFVKPVMSSSGKGQSLVRGPQDLDTAWTQAQKGGRAGAGEVIVEGLVEFDYEITLLTVRHRQGTAFCPPIGHRQEDGDYRESWQPHPMGAVALQRAQQIAERVTTALGGWGLFGVELFVCGDEVIFSEVSPRPHDTGLVTLASQWQSEFALHVRALLGLPVGPIHLQSPAASAVILAEGELEAPRVCGIDQALSLPQVDLRLFGKPQVSGRRRMGVALARADTVEHARQRAVAAAGCIHFEPRDSPAV